MTTSSDIVIYSLSQLSPRLFEARLRRSTEDIEETETGKLSEKQISPDARRRLPKRFYELGPVSSRGCGCGS